MKKWLSPQSLLGSISAIVLVLMFACQAYDTVSTYERLSAMSLDESMFVPAVIVGSAQRTPMSDEPIEICTDAPVSVDEVRSAFDWWERQDAGFRNFVEQMPNDGCAAGPVGGTMIIQSPSEKGKDSIMTQVFLDGGGNVGWAELYVSPEFSDEIGELGILMGNMLTNPIWMGSKVTKD